MKQVEDVNGIDPDTENRLTQVWSRAYKAKNQGDLQDLYADWAEQYDADHETIGFFAHRVAAEVLERHTPNPEVAAVLDAGAGTGIVGNELQKRGYQNLTAIDLSPDMLEVAESRGCYHQLFEADLGLPLDAFPAHHFDASILVGVFSFGQAPAHALEEVVRVTKPGGAVIFTLRTDFYESDAMGVRSKMEALEQNEAWTLVEQTEPELYLPKKDPDAKFRVWCYRVRESKLPDVDTRLAEAVSEAFESSNPVKRIDHCHIWNSMASRLYDRYIELPEYYLNDCEKEILADHASEIVGQDPVLVELGCGSADKISILLDAAIRGRTSPLRYIPIDISEGAIDSTVRDVRERFGDDVSIESMIGHFEDTLERLPGGAGKTMLFFGSSIGNLESLEETVDFLRGLRERMTSDDRLVIGMDLDKDESVLRKAYEAGPRNLNFFVNMARRINNVLGGNFDLTQFEQDSSYERGRDLDGVRDRYVALKLVTRADQSVYLTRVDRTVELREGESIQVGTSRKFVRDEIERLGARAGLRLEKQWIDSRGYYSLNAFVRDDA